ncbi:ParA family protein [uncultured Desulfuromonas sp.]|uniref:ParA family protein n=1 Tax=uncultured Desulfuromonas sp. TaxID=181013 RepID=UPI0026373D75|nr:ParA family protein [uncultured Desulfuromonas sp.]
MKGFPFVVTIASEKGGVGKTTIATNLAVYLKALREDLPVTIASFDNHFSVDSMFAIGTHRGASVAGLFEGAPAAGLAQLGEYGVQFLASERELSPPDDDLNHLRRALAASNLPGILILDTRPILDYFTRSALVAADLALVPVKDRASLVNAASLQQALVGSSGDGQRMWLLPSLIDARLRLRGKIGMRDFLSFSARERGYQVLETFIAKSPKVEGLATNLSSRVYPVLTHARSTVVHRQLRDLAGFVLERFDDTDRPLSQRSAALAGGAIPRGRARRLQGGCPVCGETTGGAEGHFFFDLRSRRRGLVHGPCLDDMLSGTDLKTYLSEEGLIALETRGAAVFGPEASLTVHLFQGSGNKVVEEEVGSPSDAPYGPFLEGATGRFAEEFYRETLLLTLQTGPVESFLGEAGYGHFSDMRRRVLREILAR